MAVSLTQVQTVLHGQTSQTAAGPLTLNVLNKTEALLAKLLTLDTSKAYKVEVLSAQANGRASVQVGGLELQVKASLPLKAGDVLPLKFEQVGTAHRFVAPPATENGSPVPRNLAQQPLPPGAGAEGRPPPSAHAAVVPQAPRSGKLPVDQTKGTTKTNSLVQSGKGEALVGQRPETTGLKPNSTPPASQGQVKGPGLLAQNGAAAPIAKTAPLSSAGGPLPQSSGLLTSGGVGATLSVSPHLATQTTTTALLRAITEMLPEVAKTQLGDRPTMHIHGKGAGAQSGLLGQNAGAADLAKEVASSYKVLAGKAGDDLQDVKSLLPQRAADLNLELPLQEGQKPLSVAFFLEQDNQGQNAEPAERGYGVRFALETEETGEVFAELSLKGVVVRLGFWAARDDMVALIQERLPVLEERLAATGYQFQGAVVRQGRPDERPSPHVDQEI